MNTRLRDEFASTGNANRQVSKSVQSKERKLQRGNNARKKTHVTKTIATKMMLFYAYMYMTRIVSHLGVLVEVVRDFGAYIFAPLGMVVYMKGRHHYQTRPYLLSIFSQLYLQ